MSLDIEACWRSHPDEWQPLLDEWHSALPELVTLHEWPQYGGEVVRGGAGGAGI